MKMKRTIAALLVALMAIGSSVSVLAAEVELPVPPVQVEEDGGIVPYAEETVWCERFYQGRWQRRLWSITNECWLTDWIDI